MNKLNVKVPPQALSDLMSGLGVYSQDVTIINICDDTRKLKKGDAFLCLPRARGTKGLLEQAIEHGAVAIIMVGQPSKAIKGVACACLPDMKAAGLMLRRWFKTENTEVSCIGITGTDGKTSVAWMLREVLERHLGLAWSVGTLGWRTSANKVSDLGNTTPSLMTMHQILAKAHQEEVNALVVEVSSHGIAQERIAGFTFASAIWTTMGHDHLEDHGGFENYINYKSDFVRSVAELGGVVVANADYEIIQKALSAVKGSVSWYGKGKTPSLRWKAEGDQVCFENSNDKIVLKNIPTADFHIENLASVALLMDTQFGLRLNLFKSFDGHISTPQGRLQPVDDAGQVMIDYAHTAEGLTRCLQSARKLTQGQLLLVFGCGGNRDKAKRPEMGSVAVQYSDVCWLTSDNPRDEAQADIVEDVLAGMDKNKKLHVIDDREQAIFAAVSTLCEQDKLVIAGKGHESYIEIKGKRLPWSDQDVALRALKDREVQQCA